MSEVIGELSGDWKPNKISLNTPLMEARRQTDGRHWYVESASVSLNPSVWGTTVLDPGLHFTRWGGGPLQRPSGAWVQLSSWDLVHEGNRVGGQPWVKVVRRSALW